MCARCQTLLRFDGTGNALDVPTIADLHGYPSEVFEHLLGGLNDPDNLSIARPIRQPCNHGIWIN
jgi:hypothetical protein